MRAFIVVVTLSAGLLGCGEVYVAAPPHDINTPPRSSSTSKSTQTPPPAVPVRSVQQAATTSDPSFVGASAVTVGPGDTVYELSRRHKVPVPAIIRANELTPPYLLQVGQRIELPRGRQHKVSPGDTLYSLAQRYDVGVHEMARLNGIDPPYTIRLGEVLVVPDDTPAPLARTKVSAPAPAPAVKVSPPPAKPRQMTRAPQTRGEGEIAMIPPRKPRAPVPPPPARTRSGFIWPVEGQLLSSFGAKKGGLRNDGINIRAKRGTPVRAAENGVVAYAGNEIRGFGNLLLIKHTGGYVTAYAHNDALLVERGQKVSRGEQIATVGSTGSVGEPQLHFEIRKGRRPQDPKKFLKAG